MFGIFKNNSPQRQLETDLLKSFEKAISNIIKEVGSNEIILGIAIEGAIGSVYKIYIDNADSLSIGHGISFSETVSIIKNTTNKIRNKYFIDPTPII